MANKPAFVLVSPDGNEYPTNSLVYRQRLLARGYTDKPAPVRSAPAEAPRPVKPEPKSDN